MSALGLGEKGRGSSDRQLTDELFRPLASPSYQIHHFAKLGQKGDSPDNEEAELWQRDLGRQQ